MGRKKKTKVVINNSELSQTVLGNVEQSKFNPITLILVFVIFIAVIFYMPDITKYVENLLEGNAIVNPVGGNTNQGVDDEELEITQYPFSSGTTIIIEGRMDLTNFYISNFDLSFNIKNTGTNSLTLDNYHYYLHLYNEENTLLQRIKIDDLVITSGSQRSITYRINDENVSYMTFYEIESDAYTPFVATTNEEKEGSLICAKGYEQITYSLKDNLVYLIEDRYEINNNQVGYQTLLVSYQSLAGTYNALNGVTSNVSIGETSAVFLTTIDLSASSNVTINKIVYPNNTDAKIINFELEARGYDCN